jgi:hypothetical protein
LERKERHSPTSASRCHASISKRDNAKKATLAHIDMNIEGDRSSIHIFDQRTSFFLVSHCNEHGFRDCMIWRHSTVGVSAIRDALSDLHIGTGVQRRVDVVISDWENL